MPTYNIKSWFDDPRGGGSVVYSVVAKNKRAALAAARKMATDDGSISMHKRGTARFQIVDADIEATLLATAKA